MQTDLIRSFKDRYAVIFSTDVVGYLGNPLNAIAFFENVCRGELSFGLEAVAFKHVIDSLTPEALGYKNIHIAGFHGKIGTPVKSARPLVDLHKVKFLDAKIVDTIPLLKQAETFKRPTYVNVHNHELATLQENGGIPTLPHVTLVVENDTDPGSMNSAKKRSGETTGRIFDLVHAAKSLPNFSWKRDWKQIPLAMRDFQPHMVHIPIGTDKSDSLPPELPEEFWVSISDVMAEHNSFPIIECQWGLVLGSVICNPARDPWRVNHVRHNLKTLLGNKIILKKQ